MHRLQEMVRLHRLKKSARAIARQLKMGRNAIRGYMEALSKAGVLEGEPEDLPGLEALGVFVQEHLPSKEAPHQTSSVQRWSPKIKELFETGTKPTAIHDWLRLHETDWAKQLDLRMRRAAEPGVQGGSVWPNCGWLLRPLTPAPQEAALVLA